MTLGWSLRLDPNAYLVIGVPLTLAFQVLVVRKPLRTLWVRSKGAEHGIGWLGVGVAALLMVYPLRLLMQVSDQTSWQVKAWNGSALLGALGFGYAFEKADRQTLKALGYGLATAGLIGISMVVLVASFRHWPGRGWSAFEYGMLSFLRYLPVTFALEEVTFRGALDSHIHAPGVDRPDSSAWYVGMLWGAWHLPTMAIASAPNAITAIAGMIFLHGVTGSFLSNTWRSCGNLLAPAVVHALIDAVRNGLMRS